MSKKCTIFKLLISCPSDVKNELKIINKVIEEWNKEIGESRKVRVESTHWKKDSYPTTGKRPQEIINKQLVIDTDIILGVFWSHFGTPTGQAGSGTEEEIKLGISLGKEILLYFCERPISPHSFDQEQFSKIAIFKKEFGKTGLYCVYKSNNEFKKYFKNHLIKTIDNLTNNIKETIIMEPKKVINTEKEYKSTNEILDLINSNFENYFNKISKTQIEGLTITGNISLKKNKNFDKDKTKDLYKEWLKNVSEYSINFSKQFKLDILDDYKIDYISFKRDVFGKEPWTVKAALFTPDQELIRYRAAFSNVTGKEVYDVVRRIIEKADNYAKTIPTGHDNFDTISKLKYQFLSNENMLLPGVIGLGIRSEILHRMYPEFFSIMTRRSIWGMFYLTNQSHDFIRYEKNKDGSYRVSHEWEYDYARFTYYCNHISLLIKNKLNNYGIILNEKYWFGFSAQYLNSISEMFNDDIKKNLEWKGLP